MRWPEIASLLLQNVSDMYQENATLVGLQFPEGLLMYACLISDIIERFTSAKVSYS